MEVTLSVAGTIDNPGSAADHAGTPLARGAAGKIQQIETPLRFGAVPNLVILDCAIPLIGISQNQ